MIPPRFFMRARGDRPTTALTLLLIGLFTLAAQDILIKFIAPTTSFWQLQSIRSMSNVGLVLLLAVGAGGLVLVRPQNIRATLVRSLMIALCMTCYFGAAEQITVAQMTTGLYTYPLFVTVLATIIARERIGIWRLSALALGSVGAMLVIDPFDAAFHPLQALPVLGGLFYAFNIIILRRHCRRERPLALIFMAGLTLAMFGFFGSALVTLLPIDSATRQAVPFLLVGWPDLSWAIIGFCVLASVLNLCGHLFVSRAYQTADSSWLAPLDFTYLPFAAIWGRILFGVWPTPQAAFGMGLIAVAGMVTILRDRHVRKQEALMQAEKRLG